MKADKLTDLAAVTEAAFHKEYQVLRPVLEREAQIQDQLSRLDAQLKQVQSSASVTESYRIAGADVLWHQWEAATRRALNTELARVRSQKLAMMEDLRLAFGRRQAVEALARKQRCEKRRNIQRRSGLDGC
ncbi:conserved hypothetical protein [Ruegeria lacuscaerulensis ITI-1157]|nr:conserved hypothetical protein [Ruegeria lacuscaerulensis ITI-1157]SHJ34094.1 hypothetical protein SAMN05444404_1832 [Ruegeria lacuscaerulensis ITI-1157]